MIMLNQKLNLHVDLINLVLKSHLKLLKGIQFFKAHIEMKTLP